MFIQREERKFRDILTHIHTYVQAYILTWDQNRRIYKSEYVENLFTVEVDKERKNITG